MSIEDYRPYAYPPEWYTEVAKLNIYQRLHGAMADAKPLGKTSKDGLKFTFHGHEAVSSLVKGLAEKWRFAVQTSVVASDFQTVESYGKPRPLCIMTVAVAFVNIDDPADRTVVESLGYGIDESDKGPGKAMSYALKMAMLKTFLIYDGEPLDNEAFCYQHEREEKAINDAKKRWAGLVKTLRLDIKEEGERVKRNYGDPVTLEAILLDCEEFEAMIAKDAALAAERAARKAKGKAVEPDPEFGA
jgi:hypothetical protein